MQTNSGPTLTSGQIAELIGGKLIGPPDLLIDGVASLDEGVPGKVSFLGHVKYKNRVTSSAASLVLVPPDFTESPPSGRGWIVCEQPSSSFSKLVESFAQVPPLPPPGVHPQAVVDAGIELPASVSIGPCAVLESGVEIGEGTVIGPGCYLGHGVVVGRDCRFYPNVTIREYCRLGDRVVIHSGTAIGSDGFGYIPGREGHTKIAQRGIVQIDDDVEIGSLVSVDRARFGRTWIRRGVKIDNLVQIAHNVVVGEHCFIVAQVGISGSTRLGHHVMVGGQAGISGHLEIGDGAMIMGQSGVGKDLPAGAKVGGSPAVPQGDFVRGQINLGRLGKIKQELGRLKQEIAELKTKQRENDV